MVEFRPRIKFYCVHHETLDPKSFMASPIQGRWWNHHIWSSHCTASRNWRGLNLRIQWCKEQSGTCAKTRNPHSTCSTSNSATASTGLSPHRFRGTLWEAR
jgi:hypothetical protein